MAVANGDNYQQLGTLLGTHKGELLERWVGAQENLAWRPEMAISERELRRQSETFIDLLQAALETGASADEEENAEWQALHAFLTRMSQRHAQQGSTPAETGAFLTSIKRPFFDIYARELKDTQLASALWDFTEVLDRLTLHTSTAYIEMRNAIIRRQQADIAELSTPVVSLWRGIIGMPIIGTLDSRRAHRVMEVLLEEIAQSRATFAIIDITGVAAVDTLVAQHLIKTVAAARLMGAHCIISGVSPQIAQTIVHLGIDFRGLTTRASLSDAMEAAFEHLGLVVSSEAR